MNLNHLTEQIVALLSRYSELSAGEIARKLDVPFGNVRTLLFVRDDFEQDSETKKWKLRISR